MESRVFAIFLWVKDNPVTGNVLNLCNIVEPRKDFSAYAVGDKVKAKCPGFGVHEGVIGMIGPHDQKKELEDVLKGNQFLDLIKKYVKDPVQKTTRITSKPSPKKKTQLKRSKSQQTPLATKRKQATSQSSTENKFSTQPTPGPKQKKKCLETIAKELELTELRTQIEDIEEQPYSPCPPVSRIYKESMDVVLATDSPTTQIAQRSLQSLDTCIDCTILRETVDNNTQEIKSLQTTVSSLKEELNSTKTYNQSLQCQISNMQYYMQILWNHHQAQINAQTAFGTPTTDQRLNRVQTPSTPFQPNQTSSSPFQANQTPSTPFQANQTQSTPFQANQTPSTPFQANQTPSTPFRPNQARVTIRSLPSFDSPSTSKAVEPAESANTSSFIDSEVMPLDVDMEEENTFKPDDAHKESSTSHQEKFYNNYSKEILEGKVAKYKDFSKCSKVLLRLLYSDKEREGRSLSGIAANKKHPVKPALEHPERLDVIYEIVCKRWPNVTKTAIKGKLAEALKPSATANITKEV